MPPRVNPVILLGLVVVFILSLAISAGALQPMDMTDGSITDGSMLGVQQPVDGAADGLTTGVQQPVDGVMDGLTTVPQQLTGGGAGAALGVGEAQLGMPFVLGTEGPDTFSCVGLMRYILRTTGVDGDAPWVPEEYLGRYAPVAPGDLQPGDIVIYPGWATMYAGNGMLLNANEMEGVVTETPMDVAGEPLGIVRPPY